MFERFTDKARSVVISAKTKAAPSTGQVLEAGSRIPRQWYLLIG